MPFQNKLINLESRWISWELN
ncbi:hypothetical protein EYZ11_012028 [Aspergillus tanneri]|uniref:Uncharacterized protein n=1 Tax=Aspergillus tanneri TaxID=1220188 RepID=A0A4S3J1K7_9EURO|nr:hypothetical protein EYZ11_012028 [Aspergillus tanneri]